MSLCEREKSQITLLYMTHEKLRQVLFKSYVMNFSLCFSAH